VTVSDGVSPSPIGGGAEQAWPHSKYTTDTTPPLRLVSLKPLWMDPVALDVSSRWHEDWQSACDELLIGRRSHSPPALTPVAITEPFPDRTGPTTAAHIKRSGV